MPEPDLRADAVSALAALAASESPLDRRDAGIALTGFLDAETAQAVLHDLALDADDAVNRVVSAAIARRADPRGWVVLVLALATADEGQQGCIRHGVGEVVEASDATRLQGAHTALRLHEHPEEAIREGARRLLQILGAPAE